VRPLATSLFSALLLTAPLLAQDRKPAEGAPRAERAPSPDAPRAERASGAEGRGAPRAEFPEEIKLTDEQQAKLKEVNDALAVKVEDLAKRRNGILTPEQAAAQAAAMQKAREGNLSRQEAGEAIAAALKLTPEQKAQIEAVDQEARQNFQNGLALKAAILTNEQRAILRKLTIATGVARAFTLPEGIPTSEEQKASLKALHGEFGGRLAELNERMALLLTDERRAAREAAFREARESGKDREATTAAVEAALKMTPAEKAQLSEIEQNLRDLNQQIRERMVTILTPEQKAELEKRAGAARSRNP
jgi:Spy/CpxP family protein refolding chaperone